MLEELDAFGETEGGLVDQAVAVIRSNPKAAFLPESDAQGSGVAGCSPWLIQEFLISSIVQDEYLIVVCLEKWEASFGNSDTETDIHCEVNDGSEK